MTAEVKCWCQHCKKELPRDHKGPCPYCGSNKILFKKNVGGGVVGITGDVAIIVYKHAKTHPLFTAINIALTIISPFVGYLLDNALVGLLIGITIAIITLVLIPMLKKHPTKH